ncbi:MAG: diadenylate cyclase, partial [Planctomycetes bacterium]|nr:diadenylate cyclase [Planctomycetota bacterium]
MPTTLIVKTLVEILLLGFIIYRLILLARETRALRLLKGLFIIGFIWAATEYLDLGVFKVILKHVDMPMVMVVAVVVLFTPEIKEALARLGGRFRVGDELQQQQVLHEIAKACQEMADHRVGALIVLQRNDGLGDFVGTGVPLDAHITAPFIESVFYPKSPLHDGALIVSGRRAVAARCTLPVSAAPEHRERHLGMRHKAGAGVSEVRDAVAVIVSEERGTISCCERGAMERFISEDRLFTLLREAFSDSRREEHRIIDLKAVFTAHKRYKALGFVLAFAVWSLNSQTVRTTYDLRPKIAFGDGVNQELVWITDRREIALEDVVLSGGNFNLLRLGVNQYLREDYLSTAARAEVSLEQVEAAKGDAAEGEIVRWCDVRLPDGNISVVGGDPAEGVRLPGAKENGRGGISVASAAGGAGAASEGAPARGAAADKGGGVGTGAGASAGAQAGPEGAGAAPAVAQVRVRFRRLERFEVPNT